MTPEPATLHRPAKALSDREIATELTHLTERWDETRAALEESGGMSGSPGEWIVERLNELETEVARRKV